MSRVTLLDGGMGQELIARAPEEATPLWATQVMLDHPGMVGEVHTDFFTAGATIATTNTYAIHRDRFTDADLGIDFADLLKLALAEATAARSQHGSGSIAGSIGPLVASYRPETHPPYDEAVEKYAEVAGHLANTVDMILCETVASLAHARAIVNAAMTAGKPVWLSVTVDDENGHLLRSGEPVRDLALDGVSVILANCSAPEAMSAALDDLAGFGLPYGAYANGFQQITKDFLKNRPVVDALAPRQELGPELYADYALGWVDQGATVIGGCCEIGPAHIQELARRLIAAGHQIV